MLDFGRDTRVSLAVSLNAADDETRSRLMPINRRYPLDMLLDACRRYPLPPGRRITFEYILIRGVNDSLEDARRLARLLRPIRCKVNLIPFNPHPDCGFERPDEGAVAVFRDALVAKHFTVIVRHSKGQDILRGLRPAALRDDCVRGPISALRFAARALRRTGSTPRAAGLARLDLGPLTRSSALPEKNGIATAGGALPLRDRTAVPRGARRSR